MQAGAVEAAKTRAQQLDAELKALKKQVTKLGTEGGKAAAAKEAASSVVATQEGMRGDVIEAAAMAQVCTDRGRPSPIRRACGLVVLWQLSQAVSAVYLTPPLSPSSILITQEGTQAGGVKSRRHGPGGK